MNKQIMPFAIALLATLMVTSVAAQTERPQLSPLDNKAVVFMVQSDVPGEAIIKVIKVSPCTFDTFPPILQEMRRRGVPEAVLQAMLEAPYGPSMEAKSTEELGEEPIYHYAEHLKQMGLLTAGVPTRGLPSRRQSRARAARTKRY